MKTNTSLDKPEFTSLKITIRSGNGWGKKYIQSLASNHPIPTLLGCLPYPGTLYVQTKHPIKLKGLNYHETNDQEVEILAGDLGGVKVVIKWTRKYPRNLQVISHLHLRSYFHLMDDQIIEISIRRSSIAWKSIDIYWWGLLQWARTTEIVQFRRRFSKKIGA